MRHSSKRFTQGISACIINYNGEAYLRETLAPLWEHRDTFAEIMLIDNASEDRSISVVRRLFPTIVIYPMGTNAGPGAARNMGLRRACCKRVLMVDNDVRISPEAPRLLNQGLNEFSGAALAMPSVRWSYQEAVNQFDGAGCHYLGLMALHNQNVPTARVPPEVRKIDALVTSCFMIDLGRTNEGLSFDESFFFNYEDFDFSLRARLLGHEILAVPEAFCFHSRGTPGLSYRTGQLYPKQRVTLLIRNRWQIIFKCYSRRTLLILCPILMVYELFQALGVIKKRWFSAWLQSIAWLLSHRQELMDKRRAIQRSRSIRDVQILENGPLPFTVDLALGWTERTALGVLNALTGWYWSGIKRFL